MKNAILNVLECKQQAYHAVDMESARLTIIQKRKLFMDKQPEALIVGLDALERKRHAMASVYVMKMANASNAPALGACVAGRTLIEI